MICCNFKHNYSQANDINPRIIILRKVMIDFFFLIKHKRKVMIDNTVDQSMDI